MSNYWVDANILLRFITNYGYSRQQVADVLIGLLTSEGIILESSEQVIATLDSMATANVDFVDAYLAEVARKENESVASFYYCKLKLSFLKLSLNFLICRRFL